MKSWSDIGFKIEHTGDGSPTLRLEVSADSEGRPGESMHHSGGACAETNLIYGEPICEIVRSQEQPSFLVVGLGLGYIEMVIARETLLAGRNSSQVQKILSYESVPELREFFWKWIHGRVEELSPDVAQTYNQVCDFVRRGTALSAQAVRTFLQEHFKRIEDIQGELSEDPVIGCRFTGILYDAFSSKVTPHLWSEEFLNRFLQQAAGDFCLFSTYACRVSLKKALASQGFEVVVREGFQGKRNSTLGRRQVLSRLT